MLKSKVWPKTWAKWQVRYRYCLHSAAQALRLGGGGGISEPCPQITACAPLSEKYAPQARIVSQKKVTGPVSLEYISGPVLSPKILLVPPQAWMKFRSRTKNTSKRHDEALDFAPKTLFFGLHSRIWD